jgi:hypothetical protein
MNLPVSVSSFYRPVTVTARRDGGRRRTVNRCTSHRSSESGLENAVYGHAAPGALGS